MKVIVLLSGGIDSTTCLAIAVKKYGKENVSAVTMYYGQKLEREIEGARKIAAEYGVRHFEFDLSSIFQYSDCSLISKERDVVHADYLSQINEGGIISSYVPFRNGLMLSVCATLAQSLYPGKQCVIYLGNHASDYAYADCSFSFVEKMGAAINEGTYGLVSFVSPLINMDKAEVVRTGLELGAPYKYTWSCYEGGARPCGKCGSCIDRRRAFLENGVEDPAQ